MRHCAWAPLVSKRTKVTPDRFRINNPLKKKTGPNFKWRPDLQERIILQLEAILRCKQITINRESFCQTRTFSILLSLKNDTPLHPSRFKYQSCQRCPPTHVKVGKFILWYDDFFFLWASGASYDGAGASKCRRLVLHACTQNLCNSLLACCECWMAERFGVANTAKRYDQVHPRREEPFQMCTLPNVRYRSTVGSYLAIN